MDNLPPVFILFMTKAVPGREGIALRTIEAVKTYLAYEGELHWLIADGNSGAEYVNPLIDAIGTPEIVSMPGQAGVVWNEGVRQIYKQAPIYLRLEDDFELLAPMDITPYVELLMKNEGVGMIRLGLMPVGLNLHSLGYDGRIYFNCLKSSDYCYSGNPGLVHSRMHEAYGLFDENKNPGRIEIAFDQEVRGLAGPGIWWPMDVAAYGTYGAWAHIGEVQSYG